MSLPGPLPRECANKIETIVRMGRTAETLVAGETEQMAGVMHEFVDVGALEDRGSTLFRANEIDRQNGHQRREYSPGQDLADRDGDRLLGGGCENGCRHHKAPWDYASRLSRACLGGGLTFGQASDAADYSGATVPDFHRLPYLGSAFAISGAALPYVNIVRAFLCL